MLRLVAVALAVAILFGELAVSQDNQRPRGRPDQPGFGPPPGGGMIFAGPGGPMEQERKLVQQFDRNGDGWLNAEERAAARAASAVNARSHPQSMGPAGPRRAWPTPQTGAALQPADAAPTAAALYDPTVVRSLFLEFPYTDWEEELEAFNNTDVDVPATLIVDGETYRDVGVHFRGASSFMGIPRGYKRSLNLSLDFIHQDQRLYGYKTLNLLNAHQDPSFLRSVLYLDVARQYIPAPKANFVRVVINGEDWGLYVNAQQFNKDLIAENFPTSKGARWKVPGRPGGRAGLEYLGEELDAYRRHFEIKSDDKEESWRRLIGLCRTLNQTPLDELEAALEPILNVDGVLWFLALEVALINNDGYWVRASDYSLYLDPSGRFHLIPHDCNETFQPALGPAGLVNGLRRGPVGQGPGAGLPPPGGPPELEGERGAPPARPLAGPAGRGRPSDPPLGPPGWGAPHEPQDRGSRTFPPDGRRPLPPIEGSGVELDPLVGLDDSTKPLRSRLLAVPAWRTRYLQYVRTIAESHLDWTTLQPRVHAYASLIAPYVEADVKKLSSSSDFYRTTSLDWAGEDGAIDSRTSRGMPLREFCAARRNYLLNHPAIKELPR